MTEKLLFSTTATDAIESCTLLGIASKFGIVGSAVAIRDALFQVFHRDQSVRNNIAVVYKDLYLNKNENQKSKRQKALTCMRSLIILTKSILSRAWKGSRDNYRERNARSTPRKRIAPRLSLLYFDSKPLS